MNTLSNGSITLALPDDLIRTDGNSYSPVRQSVSQTLSGALWIDVSVAQAGEPITLAGGGDGGQRYGAIRRSAFDALRSLADMPGEVFTLSFYGLSWQVMWRHEDAPALAAVDLIDYPDPSPDDWLIPTLKFVRIA